jgi:hypothetical protein
MANSAPAIDSPTTTYDPFSIGILNPEMNPAPRESWSGAGATNPPRSEKRRIGNEEA